MDDELGYQWIKGTKPQTLAYGLNDSPVGLAAWIIEKFQSLTDLSNAKRPLRKFRRGLFHRDNILSPGKGAAADIRVKLGIFVINP
jgi:hypothetical protein